MKLISDILATPTAGPYTGGKPDRAPADLQSTLPPRLSWPDSTYEHALLVYGYPSFQSSALRG